MSTLGRGGAAIGILMALIAGFEGLRLNAYPDPATGGKPWTICYGHTAGVGPNTHFTLAECKALLRQDLKIYADGIEKCVKVPLPDKRWVALVSFAYNVGIKNACNSSVVKLLNRGLVYPACDALLQWNKAAGIVFPGLTKRRQKERELCLSDF